jgi:hypothetical protein
MTRRRPTPLKHNPRLDKWIAGMGMLHPERLLKWLRPRWNVVVDRRDGTGGTSLPAALPQPPCTLLRLLRGRDVLPLAAGAERILCQRCEARRPSWMVFGAGSQPCQV